MKYLSVYESDQEILKALSDIHLRGRWFDLDCTFSKGVFWEGIQAPQLKSDLNPLYDDVIQADCQQLEFVPDESLSSIVFDPPFLFRNRKAINNDKMCRRFSYFQSYDELITMYTQSLNCFHTKLKPGGYVFFKCQDMTDNKFYCTHGDIIAYAEQNGFELRDIVIKKSKNKLQRDAVQQNCVAKTHSYWLVLKTRRGCKV